MSPEFEASREGSRLEGRYANYFTVGHNAVEFLLDFGQCFQEGDVPQLHTRIVTSPSYVKSLLETMQRSIDQYEQTFGTIRDREE